MDALLFSRNPKLEIIFKVMATFGMAAFAVATSSWLLGLLAFFLFLGLRASYVNASVAAAVGPIIPDSDRHVGPPIPKDKLALIHGLLTDRLPERYRTPALMAQNVLDVWQRICNRVPGPAATAALLLFYFASLVGGVIAPFMFEAAHIHARRHAAAPRATPPTPAPR
jgi:hypothetical protein